MNLKILIALSFLPLSAFADHEVDFLYTIPRVSGGGEHIGDDPSQVCSEWGSTIEADLTLTSCGSPSHVIDGVDFVVNQVFSDGSIFGTCTVTGFQRFSNDFQNGCPVESDTPLSDIRRADPQIRTVVVEHDEGEDRCEGTIGVTTVLSSLGSIVPDAVCLAGCNFNQIDVGVVFGDPEEWIAEFEGDGEECNVQPSDEEVLDLGPPEDNGGGSGGTDSPDGGSDESPDTDTGGTPDGSGGGTPDGSGGGSPDGDGSGSPDGDGSGSPDGDNSSGGNNGSPDGNSDEETEVGSISGGLDCSNPPQCSGDPLLCALNLQQFNTRCDLQIVPDDADILSGAGLTDLSPEMLEGETIDLPSRFDTTGFLSGRSCPTNGSLNVLGASLEFDYAPLCSFAELLSFFMLILGAFHSTRILIGD